VAHIKTFHLIKINGNTGTQQQKKNINKKNKAVKREAAAANATATEIAV